MKNNYNIKGIKHIYEPEIYIWEHVELTFKKIIKLYNYDEIKLQLIEKTILFQNSLGENTDIIKKLNIHMF